MALLDYITLGGVEIANAARLAAYLDAESVGSPLSSFTPCSCPTITAESLGDLPYTTPAEDEAPWYDPDLPVSEDFAGLLVLSIEGLDEYPVRRAVTNAVTGGGVLGPARVLPRTMVVTGILLGRTCCGVEYGLHWLSEALQGCAGNECDGDCMELLSCCPDEELSEECLNEAHRRTLRRVALVDGPRVVSRAGDGCSAGECAASGADVVTVEFTLVAATPWLWTDPVPLIEVAPPLDDSTECVTWCLDGGTEDPTLCLELTETCPPGSFGVEETTEACDLAWPVNEDDGPCDGTCRLAACADPTALCPDPLCKTPTPPTVEAPQETCFCLPLAVERRCCDVDLSACPAWAVDVPIIIVRAGSKDLRNLTITFFERSPNHEDMTCEEIADAERCNTVAVFHIAYVPAGGALTLDGQTGRPIVECGGVCESSPDVYGLDGGPLKFPTLTCASYVICMESDLLHPPSGDAVVTVSVTGRGF
ncbi:hypothetical protein [Streptomyces sp. NRRL B-1347]|uniref:hypothetical protein n=1 Tax=Streptomyces sp. NRRL B-1347 TaxID=1476877 RepID=UPI0004CA240D|nr:hypothetical protein [Streptomyces sp. NRRL B-1347]